MVKCGNCEYTYNKSTQVYTATWRESGSKIVGKGFSKDYNNACRQAANSFCFSRDGKACSKTPSINCNNRSSDNTSSKSKSGCNCLPFDFTCAFASLWNGCDGNVTSYPCPVDKNHHDYDCCNSPIGFSACVAGKSVTKGGQDAIKSTQDAVKSTVDTLAKYAPYIGIGLAAILVIVVIK